MIELLILGGWTGTGLLSAPRLRARGDSLWALAPFAATFGPLWPAVALERRRVAESEEP